MISKFEYSGPYRWDEAKERCANDYGPPSHIHYGSYQPMTKQETEDYYEKLAEIELDTINF